MPGDINESDWKTFRQLRGIALERFCQRVLDEVGQIAADTDKTSHDRYRAVYKLVEERDEELAIAFNNPRRSDAFRQLLFIVSLGLLTEGELAQFMLAMCQSIESCRNL